MKKSRRIMIPIDGSENCKRAFNWTIENVYQANDVLVLVHVIEPPVLRSITLTSGMKLPTDEWEKNITSGIKKSESLQDDYSVECTMAKIAHEYHSLTSKTPGEGICEFIEEKSIDLIVIGNRGLGKLKRTFMGSVSDYVVHHSCAPVTVVPPMKE